jgi:hypothetical protein
MEKIRNNKIMENNGGATLLKINPIVLIEVNDRFFGV